MFPEIGGGGGGALKYNQNKCPLVAYSLMILQFAVQFIMRELIPQFFPLDGRGSRFY